MAISQSFPIIEKPKPKEFNAYKRLNSNLIQ